MLASTLIAPAAQLWASAGDANQQGTNGTVTGTPAVKTPKKHHGRHHKKTAATTTGTSNTPGTK
jgi:hypothetical protein